MKHCIIIIGKDLRLNKFVLNSFLKEYEKIFKELPNLEFINSNDLNIHFLIESLSFRYNYITILTSNQNHHIITKILGTLTTSKLEIINDNLVLNSAINVKRDSFLIRLNQSEINLLKITPFLKLPKILLTPKINFRNFFIFSNQLKKCLSKIEPLAKKYEIKLDLIQLDNFFISARLSEKKFSQVSEFLKDVKNMFKIILEDEISIFINKKMIDKKIELFVIEDFTSGLFSTNFIGNENFKGSFIKNKSLNSKDEIIIAIKENLHLSELIVVIGKKQKNKILIGIGDKNSIEIKEFEIINSPSECINMAFGMLLDFKSELFF